MKSYILSLLKSRRDPGTFRHCRRAVIWGHCAPHGRAVPLVTTPLRILREERNAAGVTFDVVASDQRHECPESAAAKRRPTPKRRRGAAAVPTSTPPRQRIPAFASFTTERLAQLRAALDAPRRQHDAANL